MTQRNGVLPDVQQFAGLSDSSCRYGLFDRSGGISEEPFASLNIGLTVGDSPALVAENRQRVKEQMGVKHLLSGRQVHEDNIFLLDQQLTGDLEVNGYDALVTNQRDVGLMIQHADCQAVLLYDPKHQVIAAVHSGWRGSVLNLIGKTVQAMQQWFNSDPAVMHAVISPSLGPCCAEFVNYRQELPAEFQQYMDDQLRFDFWQISRGQLLERGLDDAAILLPTVCTCCSERYFSYRRACKQQDGITGRNCSVITL